MSRDNGILAPARSVPEKKTRATLVHMVNPQPEIEPIRLELVLGAADLDSVIKGLVNVIEEAEERLAEQKRVVNGLCASAGRPPMYTDVERKTGGFMIVTSDEFYGQPLATAIRSVLEKRKAAGIGPAAARDIYETLGKGGFKFEAKDEDNAIRGLRQSLTKNSTTFHKLPNGLYGLLEWYPNAKPARPEEGGDE